VAGSVATQGLRGAVLLLFYNTEPMSFQWEDSMKSDFGEFFAKMRRERVGLSLREFCTVNQFDAGNISKLERGRLAVPQSQEILERYAEALDVAKGSDNWYRFFDLAAAERGKIPEDLLSDEEVVGKLPVLFRTLRGEKVTEEQMKGLIDLIRRA
jgi:transcriptional regulator with XRE-family HTH domain